MFKSCKVADLLMPMVCMPWECKARSSDTSWALSKPPLSAIVVGNWKTNYHIVKPWHRYFLTCLAWYSLFLRENKIDISFQSISFLIPKSIYPEFLFLYCDISQYHTPVNTENLQGRGHHYWIPEGLDNNTCLVSVQFCCQTSTFYPEIEQVKMMWNLFE